MSYIDEIRPKYANLVAGRADGYGLALTDACAEVDSLRARLAVADAALAAAREAVDNVRAALRLIVDTVATNSWGHYDLSSIKRTALEGIAALHPATKEGRAE